MMSQGIGPAIYATESKKQDVQAVTITWFKYKEIYLDRIFNCVEDSVDSTFSIIYGTGMQIKNTSCISSEPTIVVTNHTTKTECL